jgi:hypothetical protein
MVLWDVGLAVGIFGIVGHRMVVVNKGKGSPTI